MLAHTQSIVKQLKAKLPKGAGNQPDTKTGQYDDNKISLVYSYQLISRLVEGHFIHNFPSKKPNKGNIFLRSLLAEIYQCANCYEQSCATVVEMVKSGVKEPLEIIKVWGFLSHGGWGWHAIPVINRKIDSPLHWIYNWNKETIIADAWANKIKSLEKGAPQFGDLMGDFLSFISPSDTQIILRIENNFSAEDWNEVVSYLETAKKMITLELVTYCFKQHNVKLQPETELVKIRIAINEKINEYKKFAIRNTPSPLDEKSYSPRVFSPKTNTQLVKEHTASKLTKLMGYAS